MHNLLLIIWSMLLPSRTSSNIRSILISFYSQVNTEMISKTTELGKQEYINFLYYFITVIFGNLNSSSYRNWILFEIKNREDFIFNTFILQKNHLPFDSFLVRSVLNRLAFKIKNASGETSYVFLPIVLEPGMLTEVQFTAYQNTLEEKLIVVDTSYDDRSLRFLRGFVSNV